MVEDSVTPGRIEEHENFPGAASHDQAFPSATPPASLSPTLQRSRVTRTLKARKRPSEAAPPASRADTGPIEVEQRATASRPSIGTVDARNAATQHQAFIPNARTTANPTMQDISSVPPTLSSSYPTHWSRHRLDIPGKPDNLLCIPAYRSGLSSFRAYNEFRFVSGPPRPPGLEHGLVCPSYTQPALPTPPSTDVSAGGVKFFTWRASPQPLPSGGPRLEEARVPGLTKI